MLTVRNVSVQFGARALFRDLTFTVSAKDRLAFVGPNGAGKSTLMKILAGIENADSGDIQKPRDLSVGYLPQEGIHISGTSLFREVERAFGDVLAIRSQLDDASAALEATDPATDPERYGDLLERFGALQLKLEHHDVARMKPRIETVLNGLGFRRSDFDRDTGEFSGGWQMRIALAKLLLQEPDVLLLDEPTNHLDLDSQRWVEGFLQGYAGAIILISHDRAFLDSLVHRVLAFERTLGRVDEYAGNYSFYAAEKEARRDQQVRAFKNQQREIERTQKLIDRFRAKATKASMVQSRIKQLAKMERIEIEEEEKEIQFRFPQPRPSGHSVMKLSHVTKQYGDHVVFRDFSFEVERGDRIAVVGVNGAGKSTFSRLAAGIEQPSEGTCTPGYHVTISYFSQNHADDLPPDRTVLETVESAASREAAPHVRTLLGCFLFRGDDVFKTVGVLSGGERSRVALARMLVQPANLLVLDEPTNHLDMESQEVLQRALADFSGTYLIVSHNRCFLDPVVNKVLEFIPGSPPRLFLGNVSDYLDKKRAEEEAAAANAAGRGSAATPGRGASGAGSSPGITRQEERRLEAKRRQERASRLKPLTAKRDEVEARIAALEEEKRGLVAAMQRPEFFDSPEEAKLAARRFQEIEAVLERQFTEWSAVEEEIERVEARFGGDDGAAPSADGETG